MLIKGFNLTHVFRLHTERTYDVIITSLLHQNDVTTSFLRNSDVIITPGIHWDIADKSTKCRLHNENIFSKITDKQNQSGKKTTNYSKRGARHQEDKYPIYLLPGLSTKFGSSAVLLQVQITLIIQLRAYFLQSLSLWLCRALNI